MIEDDGVGGADIETGTGLRGLVDRLSALDGTLELETPEGGGTRLIARIPLRRRRPDPRPWTRTRSSDEARAAAGAPLLLALAAAGCGKVSEVREPDVFARRGHQARPGRRPEGADGSGSIRIAVVTHGAAASAFWAIVKNGVDAAARQMTVLGLLPLARHLQRRPHEGAHLPGGRLEARTGSSSRSPIPPSRRPSAAPSAPASPSSSINSGANLWRDLGVLAHVGQRETPAGYQVGKRMAASGVKRALCVKQELRNNALDQRCRGFARGMREGGGSARNFVLDVTDRDIAAPKLRGRARRAEGRRRPDALQRRGQDLARGQEGGRPRDAGEARHLRPLARDPRGDQGRAHALRRRPAGLPPGLHADRAADPADPLRPLPRRWGRPSRRGPNFVTKDNAQLAMQTSARGMR